VGEFEVANGGHDAGIGIRQHRSQSELIELLLPKGEARVTREGVNFNKLAYAVDTAVMTQWTAKARNFGSWDIPIQHFPGSISRIWTPDMEGAGLLELMLTDQANASSIQTYEETLEAFAYASLKLPETNHDRISLQLEIDRNSKELVKQAKKKTAEATSKSTGSQPSMTEARHLEALIAAQPTLAPPCALIVPGQQDSERDDSDAFSEMMKSLLKATGT
jgi:putative transposase